MIINCGDELEKKRVDYVIEKWGVHKVKGYVLKLKELNEDFIMELYSKLIKGNIEIYKLQPIREEPIISKTRRQLRAYFNNDINSVDKFIIFIFSKINAVSEGIMAIDNTIERKYSVYVRGKGKVEVVIRIKKEDSNKVLAELVLEGPENAVNSFVVDLARDLKFLEAEVEL